jgi:hypothetical protein
MVIGEGVANFSVRRFFLRRAESRSERLKQECAKTESDQPFERRDSHRIVAARQGQSLDIYATSRRLVEKRIREFGPEGGIVAAGDGENFLSGAEKLGDVRKRADGRPVAADVLLRKF